MRLRQVGPGIGGLNYSPLLRDTPRIKRSNAAAPAAVAGRGQTLWQAVTASARQMGRRLVDARMAQAERLIELESRRLFGREAGRFSGNAIGSRYY